jgi:hypothetical protein
LGGLTDETGRVSGFSRGEGSRTALVRWERWRRSRCRRRGNGPGRHPGRRLRARCRRRRLETRGTAGASSVRMRVVPPVRRRRVAPILAGRPLGRGRRIYPGDWRRVVDFHYRGRTLHRRRRGSRPVPRAPGRCGPAARNGGVRFAGRGLRGEKFIAKARRELRKAASGRSAGFQRIRKLEPLFVGGGRARRTGELGSRPAAPGRTPNDCRIGDQRQKDQQQWEYRAAQLAAAEIGSADLRPIAA